MENLRDIGAGAAGSGSVSGADKRAERISLVFIYGHGCAVYVSSYLWMRRQS